MGYQEKRSWILLASYIAFYAVYFWLLHHGGVRLVRSLYVVLAMIVLQVVLQPLLAATASSTRRDERDVLIENRAYRVGYFALSTAVVAVIAAVAHLLTGPVLQVFFIVNSLLFVLGVAQVAKLVAQVMLYRRLA